MDTKQKRNAIIGWVIIIISMSLLLVSCGESSQNNAPKKEKRIKIVECTTIDMKTFYIIEVDGKEYLTQYDGGFVELTKE